MMSWVLTGLGIVLSVFVIGIVFWFGMVIGFFVITKSMYECLGIDYSFKQCLKEIFGHGETDT